MKSVVLCEGADDLWFIAYYLHKQAGWSVLHKPTSHWNHYKLPESDKQQVQYLCRGSDDVGIWSVGGKDSIPAAFAEIANELATRFPMDPIHSIVNVRDRDDDDEEDILDSYQKQLQGKLPLDNGNTTIWETVVDGDLFRVGVTPLIIPIEESGAIEKLLLQSVEEDGPEGAFVVSAAQRYIQSLICNPEVAKRFLPHERLREKARFDSVVAAINPGHSTGQFRELVMSCPWENSPSVKKCFDIVAKAILMNFM